MEHQLVIVVLLGLSPLVLVESFFHSRLILRPAPYASLLKHTAPRARASFTPRQKLDKSSRNVLPLFLTNGQWLVRDRNYRGGYRSTLIPSFYTKRADSVDNHNLSPFKRVHACPFFHRLGRPLGDCYGEQRVFKTASQRQPQRFDISKWPILHMLGGALGKRGGSDLQRNGFFQYL